MDRTITLKPLYVREANEPILFSTIQTKKQQQAPSYLQTTMQNNSPQNKFMSPIPFRDRTNLYQSSQPVSTKNSK